MGAAPFLPAFPGWPGLRAAQKGPLKQLSMSMTHKGQSSRQSGEGNML